MIGICPRCEAPINSGHGRVFCVPCGTERRRLINRNVMRAIRQGLPKPLRLCVLCPTEVRRLELFCPPCKYKRAQAAWHRFNTKPETRERNRIRAREPKQKLAAYARSQKPEYKARKRARDNARQIRITPYEAKCQTLFCEGTFTRNRWNGRRMFCDSCRWMYGYVTTSWRRPKRRAA